MILGQTKIINKVNTLTLDNCPHSLILLGDIGSGKHLICSEIAKKLNVEIVDITDKLSFELIESINSRAEPYLYIINAKDISVKDENVILKFLEEPLNNAYIILCVDSKAQVLNTVFNRCQVWELEKYSKEDLSTFIKNDTDKDLLLDIVNTPGKLLALQDCGASEMFNLANTIIDSIGVAHMSNILTLPNKFKFKDEVGLFDFNLFVDILVYSIKTKIQNTDNTTYIDVYKLINKLSNDRYIAHIDKKLLFENFLCNMKELLQK